MFNNNLQLLQLDLQTTVLQFLIFMICDLFQNIQVFPFKHDIKSQETKKKMSLAICAEELLLTHIYIYIFICIYLL